MMSVPAASGDAGIVINEIMYHPLVGDPTASEYIELYNYTDEDVELSGWSFADGIQFTFPAETVLPAGEYLVLSLTPDITASMEDPSAVYGPFDGKLDNEGESIRLVDAEGMTVDSLMYRDEHGWPQSADGDGNSLERRHPLMTGTHHQSWSEGPMGGTPGRANASSIPLPEPVVFQVQHNPLIPAPGDEIQVTCKVESVGPLSTVLLFHRKDGDPSFGQSIMEKGADGLYRADLGPGEQGDILEFVVQAVAESGAEGRFPVDAPARSAVLQVDANNYPNDLPLYRIVMRRALEQELYARNVYSNEQLDACFYAGGRVYYNVGVRFRGKGSRHYHVKSYRVDFTDTEPFGAIRKLNLNAQRPEHQLLGLEFFDRSGMPAPKYQLISVIFNNQYVREYIQVERCDKDMMQRVFGNEDGNLYRGVEYADLNYRGEDEEAYRQHYVKETNEREDDYSDVIELCAAFTNSTDEEFPQAVQQQINVDQWLRWFAAKVVLNDEEKGIANDYRGDDYYIYHNPEDDLFYILPWDLDSVLMHADQPLYPQKIPSVLRLLTHSDFAPKYLSEISSLESNEFAQERMAADIELTAPILPEERRAAIQQVVEERHEVLQAQLPTTLTVNYLKSGGERIFFQPGDVWKFFRGRTAPVQSPPSQPPPQQQPQSEWAKPDFDDSGWEQGQTGIGYGDGDDETVLDDMRGNYLSVFVRIPFAVQDTDAISSLSLNMDYDDSFIAYLNGHEIARSNVTGDPPAFDQSADGNHEAGTPEEFNVADAVQYLQDGENVLAIEGHNVSLTSSDFSLIPSLEAATDGLTRSLVEPGDDCQFHRGTTNPNTDEPITPPDDPEETTIEWAEPGFDDSSWESGPTGIGYGDGDDQTVLGDMRNNYVSCYIRREFEVVDPSAVSSLTFTMNYDDSFIAYLNGHEVARSNNISGNPPDYDQTASGGHEAGTPEEFDLRNAIQYLVEGTNVFAIEGHNVSITSSDFSLIPTLQGELTGDDVRFYGTAPADRTSSVTVNGLDADYDPTEGTWETTIIPVPGINEVLVEARDPDGNVVESAVSRLYMPGQGRVVGVSIASDERWTPEGGPYYIESDLIVPWGFTLTIDEGTQLLLGQGVGITVYGQLFINGTPENRIRFAVEGWRGHWKGIALDRSYGECILRGCDFSFGSQAEGGGQRFNGVVSVRGATVTVEDSLFTHLNDKGVEAEAGNIVVRNCVFDDLGEGIHCEQSSAVIESCTFSGLRGHEDAIDLDDNQGTLTVLRHVSVLGSQDDGFDLGNGAILIDSCRIADCVDKAISVEGPGLKTIQNSLIVGSDVGIEAKHQGEVRLINCTIAGNQNSGIHLLEEDVGFGGGSAAVTNTILWGNGVGIASDATSDARVDHSVVQGGYAGESVLDAEPRFVNAAGGDYRLDVGSPCIDTGTATDAPETDYAGEARPLGSGFDMGAFEHRRETAIDGWMLFRR